jgi:hypothetical protein
MEETMGAKQEPEAPPSLSDEAILEMQRRRFAERVARVLEVMQRERIDWRGAPHITADGRIAVRVLPVEGLEQ